MVLSATGTHAESHGDIMAKRYCGSIELDIKLQDDSETYTVRLRRLGGGALCTQDGIKLSPYDRARIAADSSEAYDKVAQASLSFACNDLDELWALCSMDSDSDSFAVYRKRPIPAVSQDEHEEAGLDALRRKELVSL